MNKHIQVIVGTDGILKMKSSEIKPGDEINLMTKPEPQYINKGKWSDIEEILSEVDELDLPRRTHDEILKDLHELRG